MPGGIARARIVRLGATTIKAPGGIDDVIVTWDLTGAPLLTA